MPLAVDTDAIKSYVPHGITERAFAIYPNSDTVNAKVPCSARVAVAISAIDLYGRSPYPK